MYALGARWEGGYLDPALPPEWVRVTIRLAIATPVREPQFFERPLDLWMLLNYFRAVGPRDVVRKVRSRSAERFRNRKCVLIGMGEVTESRSPSIAEGAAVAFIAPNAAPLLERIALPASLVQISAFTSIDLSTGAIMWRWVEDPSAIPPDIMELSGWSPFSGTPLPQDIGARLEAVPATVLEHRSAGFSRRPLNHLSPVQERTIAAGRKGGATFFGYGNYVKTMVLPELSRNVAIDCVHEIDTHQIGRRPHGHHGWDTAWWLRDDEAPEVVVVAGYNHMHASLATEAILRGARAVIIEKPVATTRLALDELVEALEERDAAVFVAFQRRYTPFNDRLMRDLGVTSGNPVSCIASAYEVPLPESHWYRWQNSGSRLLSNGCHWLDHFFYLNSYSSCTHVEVSCPGPSTTVVTAALENGAVLSFTLTELGSPRLGVRDHCEFRVGRRTVTVEDMSRYRFEDERRETAGMRKHRLHAHRTMYAAIGERIGAGDSGDDLSALRESAELVLRAEQALASFLCRI